MEEVVKTGKGEEIRRQTRGPSSDKPIPTPCMGFAIVKGGEKRLELQGGEVGAWEALAGAHDTHEDLGTGRCGNGGIWG